MLRIRFFRTGKKNQPFFRIVVTDRRNPPKGGRFLEVLGFYNPLTKEKQLKKERIKYWLSVGAQPSAPVHNLLIEEKVLEGDKAPVHKKPKRKPTSAKAPAGKAEKPEAPKPEETKEEPKRIGPSPKALGEGVDKPSSKE